MSQDNTDRIELNRRAFVGAAGAGLFASNFAGTATAETNNGGNGGNGGDGNGDDGTPGGNRGENQVTLITGQTIYVTDREDERVYAVEDGDNEVYDVLEREEGTYIIPESIETAVYSDHLFNVDFLIEQGFTDAEADATPVIVSYDQRRVRTADVGDFAADSSETRDLHSVGALATAIPKSEAAVASRAMTQTPGIERVSLDKKYEAQLDGSAPAIGLADARDNFDVDGSGVTIGIVDTGIDDTHPDLEGRVVNAADFTGEGPGDENGHGTHVAGIAAGDGTESDGEYVGAAPGATLMDAKVLGALGSGQTSGIIEGIEWAVGEGADVINLSLGGAPQEDDPLDEAINWANEQGVTPVIAAGNETFGSDYGDVSSPGTAEGSITVGATDHTGDEPTLAEFTAYGPAPFDYRVKPDVVAPGVELTAAGSEDAGEAPYTDKSGTSMSAPMVAGLVALLLEDGGELGPEGVRNRLMTTAEHVPDDSGGQASDVYQEGAGEVVPSEALGTDLVVHNPVSNFGLLEVNEEATATIVLENVGDEAIDLETAVEVRNVSDGAEYDENVSVAPAELTVDASDTAEVTLEVDAGEAFGHNAGVVVFDADETTYRSIFGFTAGLAVTVEKIPHENTSDGTVAGDSVWLWSQDGAVDADANLGTDGTASFLLFEEEATITAWSSGQLEPTEDQENAPVMDPAGDPVLTVKSNIHVDADNDHIVLDENETVPRNLDTSLLDEAEPFVWREYSASLFAIQDIGSFSYGRRFIGDFRVHDSHVSPIEENEPTNVATDYFFAPGDAVDEGQLAFASPAVYYLFDGVLSIGEDGEPYVVDHDELATEHITYHHDYKNQVFTLLPGIWPADREHFPTGALISWGSPVPDLPPEQTWYRTAEGEYTDDWDDAEDESNYGISTNYGEYVPDADTEYHTALNREPLLGQFTDWDLSPSATGDDGILDLYDHWYTDQAEVTRTVLRWDHDNPNEYEIAVDGETVLDGDGIGSAFLETVTGIEPGSTVELSTYGNALRTFRGTSTVTRYETTYDPDRNNTPPAVTHVDVAGLTTLNEVAAGSITILVETSVALDTFEAYYADSVAEAPFADDAGWTEAEVLYDEGDVYGVRVDVTEHDDLSLAFRGTDAAGRVVESTSLGAISVGEWAEYSVPIDVRPDTINVGSNQTVPVAIEPTDEIDPHELDADSLRFGSPEAVADGDGAPAERVQRLGNGTLQAQFRAATTGYDDNQSPAGAFLVAELEDGTVVSGSDVVDAVEGI